MTGTRVSWVVAVPLLGLFLVGGIIFWVTMPEIYMGQIWVLIGLGLLAYYTRATLKTHEAERIASDGIPGTGRILEMTDTGTQVNNRPLIKLKLRIEAPGIDPFEIKKRLVMPHTSLGTLRAGSLPVVLDRKNHKKVIIDLAGTSSPNRAATPTGPSGFPGTIPGLTGLADPEQRLEKLRRLRDQSLIDEAEYETKRRQILDSL